jgi:hypothetical protein
MTPFLYVDDVRTSQETHIYLLKGQLCHSNANVTLLYNYQLVCNLNSNSAGKTSAWNNVFHNVIRQAYCTVEDNRSGNAVLFSIVGTCVSDHSSQYSVWTHKEQSQMRILAEELGLLNHSIIA